jgi:hypothetical protein
MRSLFGKIAIAAGSTIAAGVLLVVAYLAAGAFILACLLSAVFLIGERMDVVSATFVPIAISAGLAFAAASWGLAALGAGAWWLWRGRRPRGEGPAPPLPGR